MRQPNFIAFWRLAKTPALHRIMFVDFLNRCLPRGSAVGLAFLISIYRHYRRTNVDQIGFHEGINRGTGIS